MEHNAILAGKTKRILTEHTRRPTDDDEVMTNDRVLNKVVNRETHTRTGTLSHHQLHQNIHPGQLVSIRPVDSLFGVSRMMMPGFCRALSMENQKCEFRREFCVSVCHIPSKNLFCSGFSLLLDSTFLLLFLSVHFARETLEKTFFKDSIDCPSLDGSSCNDTYPRWMFLFWLAEHDPANWLL